MGKVQKIVGICIIAYPANGYNSRFCEIFMQKRGTDAVRRTPSLKHGKVLLSFCGKIAYNGGSCF